MAKHGALPCRDRNFDDADRSGGGAEEEDAGPSRADQSDNWGRDRRPQEPDSRDRGRSRGFEDRPRMGGFRDRDSSGCASWGALPPALASVCLTRQAFRQQGGSKGQQL